MRVRMLTRLGVSWLVMAVCLVTVAQAQPRKRAPMGPTSYLKLRSARGILARIESMIGADLKDWCKKKGITYPPREVLFRVFKQEKAFEIWGRSAAMKKLVLIKTIVISKMDFAPGPKLKRGDHKTPEGFYRISRGSFGYRSSHWWMWMCLDEKLIDKYGQTGKCSCFKICINYPNSLDRLRSRRLKGGSPGSAICIHGNKVTAGCISFANRSFLPVFAFARRHDFSKAKTIQLHIFPFRFNKADLDLQKEAKTYFDSHKPRARLTVTAVLHFWANLRLGFERFNSNSEPLGIVANKKRGWRWTPSLVRQLQLALKLRGHYTTEPTGVLDAATRSAVKALQKANRQRATGVAGHGVRRLLNIYWFR